MNIESLYKDIKIKDGDFLVFACSYGPDSMALFNSLLELRKKYDIRLVCAHVNHDKRRESAKEKEDLEAFCKENNVIFEYMKIDRYGDDNFHNEARNIRYQFFDEVVKKYNAKYLLTAHHGDDLMETILMRIARGSTLRGYSGFRKLVKMDGYYIYRPFISLTKSELLDYCHKNKIPYAIDKSNFSDVYTRNRYRKEVLPFLKSEDKDIHKKYLKFSNVLSQADDFIEEEASKAISKVIKDNKLYIDKYLEINKFLKRIILERFISSFYQDDLILINDKHLDLIESLINSKRSNAKVNLPNDVEVVKSYNTLSIRRNPNLLSSYEIEVSREVILPNGHKLELLDSVKGNSNNIIKLSSKDVTLPLIVRTRKLGDVMAIKGGGHKKIKDIFIDSKIPFADRDLWPIVVDSRERIVFVPGLKKSKFDKTNSEFYDIILRYE